MPLRRRRGASVNRQDPRAVAFARVPGCPTLSHTAGGFQHPVGGARPRVPPGSRHAVSTETFVPPSPGPISNAVNVANDIPYGDVIAQRRARARSHVRTSTSRVFRNHRRSDGDSIRIAEELRVANARAALRTRAARWYGRSSYSYAHTTPPFVGSDSRIRRANVDATLAPNIRDYHLRR
jgi:hypothetical protein